MPVKARGQTGTGTKQQPTEHARAEAGRFFVSCRVVSCRVVSCRVVSFAERSGEHKALIQKNLHTESACRFY